ERHVVHAREEPQLAHEPCACDAHATLALDRLDEHRGDTPRPLDDLRAERRPLRVHEFVNRASIAGPRVEARKKLVDRIDLPPVCVLALFSAGQTAGHEQIPQLLEAAILAPRGLLRRSSLFDLEWNVRPTE